jgi:hypothetical protein
MRVLPHRPSPMPGCEHRSRPARRHIGRQRFYNLPELLEIVPVPGIPGWARRKPTGAFSLPETPRPASDLDDVLQFIAHFPFPLAHKCTRPGVLSEHPGLVAFDLSICWLGASPPNPDA